MGNLSPQRDVKKKKKEKKIFSILDLTSVLECSFVLYDEVQKDFLLLHTYSFVIVLEPPGAIQGP